MELEIGSQSRTRTPKLRTLINSFRHKRFKIILPTTSLLNSDPRQIPQEITDDL